MAAGTIVAIASPAAAAISSPPAAPHSIIVFPSRDFVSAVSDPNAAVSLNLIRAGVTIGSATGVAGPDGVFEVNHPGGVCWIGTTPDIIAGDVVQMTTAPGVGDATPTADVVVTQPASLVGTDVVVKGWAKDAAGAPLPAGQVQQRMISKPLFSNGKRDLRAGALGGDGAFAYDAVGSPNWTVTYAGLSPSDRQIAIGAESRILWLGRNPGALTELTIFDGQPAGPTTGCPAAARYAVTTSAPPSFSATNTVGGVTLSGVAQDASAVSVSMTDSAGGIVTAIGALSAPAGAQAWTATFTAAQVAGLALGPITAAGSYTVVGGVIGGATMTIQKNAAVLSTTPAAGLSFGPTKVAKSSASSTVTVINTGNIDMHVSSVSVTGTNPDEFVIDADGCAGATVAPHGTCAISVHFAPTATGVREAGLTLADDAAANPQSIPLSGQGTAPRLTFLPATVDFGSQLILLSATDKNVILQNTGDAVMELAGTQIGGPNTMDYRVASSTCGTELAAGASCSVTVHFVPIFLGTRTASLDVASDAAPASPKSAQLTGRGNLIVM
jgi:hypothetical protein